MPTFYKTKTRVDSEYLVLDATNTWQISSNIHIIKCRISNVPSGLIKIQVTNNLIVAAPQNTKIMRNIWQHMQSQRNYRHINKQKHG